VSRPIQALAPGFLGLLGLKNNGALPPDFIDAVAPTIDLARWYLEGNRETIVTAGVDVDTLANFAFPEFIVPSSQVWYVHALTVQINVPAANAWQGSAVHFNRNGQPIRTGTWSSQGGAASSYIWTAAIGDFFMQAGDFAGVTTGSYTGAGPANAFGNIAITRLLA